MSVGWEVELFESGPMTEGIGIIGAIGATIGAVESMLASGVAERGDDCRGATDDVVTSGGPRALSIDVAGVTGWAYID